MLVITVPELESFDATQGKFIKAASYTLQLEHSLASLSKWESEFERPFLSDGPKTPEETLAYIQCMSVEGEIPPEVLERLSVENVQAITAHINKRMTATWFRESSPSGRGREVVTAELIYFWMSTYQIPFDCDQWHLNKLLVLVRVASEKNQPKKNQPRSRPSDLAAQRRQLNAERKAMANTSG